MFSIKNLLGSWPDFYDFKQMEQVKCVAYLKAVSENNFQITVGDVRAAFNELNLVVPSNLNRSIAALTRGRPPVLIKRGTVYSFHPKAQSDLSKNLNILTTDGGGPGVQQLEAVDKRENATLFEKYDLHSKIKSVSFSQFQDGYYKEAVQNAFVEVVDQVKRRTNYPKYARQNGSEYDLDGDDLMQRVFGADNGATPMLALNELANSLDRAEQRGIMLLFKGVVGIRDKKAHLNFVQNDPIKTIEYLSLASLLLHLLDDAEVVE